MKTRTNTAVWLENQNRWQIKVQKDGIRKTFTCSTPGRTGQRICNKKADEWLDEGITDNNRPSIYYLNLWLEETDNNTSTSNYRKYKSYVDNWISPQIGRIKLSSLNIQHFQNIINKMNKKGLSKKSQKCMKGAFSSFLKFCRKSNLTTLTTEFVEIPKNAVSKEKQILQPHELRLLFSNSKTTWRGTIIDDFFVNAYRFQVLTGLRPGEVFGLEWKDIKGNVMSIKRSINAEGETTKGKNANAQRVLILSSLALEVLDNQKKLLRRAGVIGNIVFSREDGSVLNTRYYYFKFKAYCECNGINSISPYELRHTFVSVSKEIPQSLLKNYVGHSKDMDTLGIYGHALNGEQEKAAEEIQSVFQRILKESAE